MIGNPAKFEAIGNRLGFQIFEQSPDRLGLHWQGARFPAFLCLGLALLLLFVSVPILQALYLRGFVGPAGSLWYFPLMNVVLFGIAIFLVTQRRVIEVDGRSRRITLRRRSLYRVIALSAGYDEIREFRLGVDEIQSGFAVAGSTAAEKFFVPALRMVLTTGDTVLLDRGSLRRLKENGKLISDRAQKPLAVDSRLENPQAG
jgi:hypothetical protein